MDVGRNFEGLGSEHPQDQAVDNTGAHELDAKSMQRVGRRADRISKGWTVVRTVRDVKEGSASSTFASEIGKLSNFHDA